MSISPGMSILKLSWCGLAGGLEPIKPILTFVTSFENTGREDRR
jgi:hypothetical protein